MQLHLFNSKQFPIVCDLDNSLIRTDLVQEASFALLWNRPHLALVAFFHLLCGNKVAAKNWLARHWTPNPATLPYRERLVTYLKSQEGPVILATASPQVWADSIAQHLGCFTQVWGTVDTNLKGAEKLRKIRASYPKFIYIGDHHTADIPIWQASEGAILCDAPKSLSDKVSVPKINIDPSPSQFRLWITALRPHHWTKNLIIGLAGVTGVGLYSWDRWYPILYSIATFCFIVSGVYLINDIADLDADRVHVRKHVRPFASGRLPLLTGVCVGVMCIGIGLTLASLVNVLFCFALLYLVMNLVYSMGLKKLVLIDIVFLAGFYLLRITLGAYIFGVPQSFWFYACLASLILEFAFLKRFVEISSSTQNPRRAYTSEDATLLQILGIGFAFMATLILALYTQSTSIYKVYHHPQLLNSIIPLILYHNLHFWFIAQRRQLHDDPLVAVAKSPLSWVIGVLIAGLLYFAR